MFDNEDIVHRYTRADALADGVLVDVSAVAREAGIKFPVALTRAAWERCVMVPPGVLFQDDDFGRDYVKGLRAGLGPKASLIVAEASYELADPTINSQIVQLLGDHEFVIHGKGDGLSLSAIPERRIEGEDFHNSLLGGGSRFLGHAGFLLLLEERHHFPELAADLFDGLVAGGLIAGSDSFTIERNL